jgi:glycosyltransferase involved in cell wall biosynthesis
MPRTAAELQILPISAAKVTSNGTSRHDPSRGGGGLIEVPKVLQLAYHFPPIGGGGVQRNLEFARRLPDHGYEVIVVTGSGDAGGRWTPRDPTLLDAVPPSVAVERVSEPTPVPGRSFHRRVDKLLMRPTRFSEDWTTSVLAASERLAPDIDLIYASLVPYEAAEAAGRLATHLGVPWVADLQDPWALDEMCLYPTGLHRRADLRRMARLLSSAAAIVLNTPEAVIRFRDALPELAGKTVVSIPNGFDPDLFEDTPSRRDDEGDRFRVVHTGYLHTELGLETRKNGRLRRLAGGMFLPIDILTRSHVYLMQALEEFERTEPSLRALIDVHFAGVLSETDRRSLEGVPGVKLHGYLAHRDSVSLVRTADLLFLPMHNLPEGTRAGLVPGKTYEYVRSGRPILAAIPRGDAFDLLERLPNAHLVAPDDVAGMTAAIKRRVDTWLKTGSRSTPVEDVYDEFSHSHLVGRLASLFDTVVAKSQAAVVS